MFLTNINGSHCDINGSTKSIAIAKTTPKWDQSIGNILLDDPLKFINIQLIVEYLWVVLIGYWSFIVDVFEGKCSFWTDVAALAKIPHQFEYIWIVALYVELLHLLVLGCMHTRKNGLGSRVVYDSASCVFEQEFLGQAQWFCAPIHYDILELCESWGSCEGEVWCLVYYCKHICKYIGHVDRRRIVPEKFWGLPSKGTWKNDWFGHLHEIFDFSSLLWGSLG